MNKEYVFNDDTLYDALDDWKATLINKGAAPETADACRRAVEHFLNSKSACPLVNMDAQINLG